ncbi:MAG: HAMP domain-containing protein [Ruminococcaceae bacterium]|nr:HAMP domain-containing protein [Oscillospiraceae bacterium]
MREQFRRISIKWRIFACFAGFTLIILILLWVFQVVFLDQFYQFIKINEVKSTAQTIVKHVDSEDFETTLQSISQGNQVAILIADEYGNISYYQDIVPSSLISRLNPLSLSQIFSATEDEGGTYFRQFSRDGMAADGMRQIGPRGGIQNIIYSQIVEKANGSKVMILLSTSISPVSATVNTLRIQLVCITLFMLVLSLLLALFLSKWISKPIININASAKMLGSGKYDTVFDETGYKEISELGHTLNYAAKELSRTEELRRDLIANISHDLRTPLTMIRGYGEVMRDLPGENTPENVQIIIDEATRLASLVSDVLDISKLQSGTQPLSRADFNLTESIRVILQRYSKLTDYHISFHTDQDVYVNADELKISQVVYNLVNNAITYTGVDKIVEITQTVLNGKVRISVRDTGEGIPQDKITDIWERYYKVDKEHKRAQIGTGLGLSIVKTILDMHTGAYGVQSEEGKGSVFWFELDTLS